jgi:hypothetical protein
MEVHEHYTQVLDSMYDAQIYAFRVVIEVSR